MCDFSNILWSYGGDYFQNGEEVGRLGTEDPGPSSLDQSNAIEAANFYNELLAIANPGSTTWDWTGLAEAFQANEIAMMPEWHEFAADLERSDLEGKVGYAPLPQGPARSANMWGGTGLGINAGASEEQQKAAWLFLVWATSPETQRMGLFSEDGGGTPTRQSVYEMSEVQEAETRPSDAPNMLTAEAVSTAWEPENIGLRPKIPSWNECDTTIYTVLSRMLAGNKNPEQAMQDAKRGFDQITGAA
jgi:multiple sugar transport system substrate-binding protein